MGVLIILGLAVGYLLLRRNAGTEGRRDTPQPGLSEIIAMKAQMEGLVQSQAAFRESLGRLETGLSGLETRVVESSGGVRETLQRDLLGARSVIESLKAAQESRKVIEEELRQSARHIEAVLGGSRSRGAAGENILAEALRNLPAEMVETDFRIGGKAVEFALKLVDGTRVPIDSKWPRADLLDLIEKEESADKQAKIVVELEKAVEAKVREATKYIDASATVPWAVAAVPDAVFGLCRCAHFEAYKSKVILMPYGHAMPYLLSLYQLHLQFCRSIQVEKLESYLTQIEGSVDKLGKEIEGRMSNAITQLGNSRDECRVALARVKVASDSLKRVPGPAPE